MILNVYKPAGWTSFDVVKKIRSLIREKKVGHGGTLDPFAEGVLIVGTGKDTKQLGNISGSDKTYEATVKLGETTDTLDPEGNIITEKSIPSLSDSHILKVFNSFTGKQEQIPPMYSAKKKNGVRLYKLARKNQVVDRDPVPVTIHSLELIDRNQERITFRVTCSKGTYIRVLGQDIAQALGTVGYLTYLKRLSVGNYSVENSLSLDELQKQWTYSTA